MKKLIIIPLLLFMVLISASGCADGNIIRSSSQLRQYDSFEGTLAHATDVVIANYEESKMAEDDFMLYRFKVKNCVYGRTPEVIDVYIQNVNIEIIGAENPFKYSSGNIKLERNTDYMLVLEKSDSNMVYKKIIPYILLNETIINMNDFTQSSMYCESISKHTEGINFNKDLKQETLIEYVKEKTKDNVRLISPTQSYIESGDVDVIVAESPNIIKIKVDKLDYTTQTALLDIDVYWCTIEENLKGNIEKEKKIAVTFFADTVKPGDEYIVAVKVINENSDGVSPACYLTSKNSLYSPDKYCELKDLISSR